MSDLQAAKQAATAAVWGMDTANAEAVAGAAVDAALAALAKDGPLYQLVECDGPSCSLRMSPAAHIKQVFPQEDTP